MATLLSSAAQIAHSAAAGALSKAQVAPGDEIQAVAIKENAPDKEEQLVLSGRNIIVGVPGAFTGSGSKQIPGYIDAYDRFKAKGVNEIYVVAVNDVFVTKCFFRSFFFLLLDADDF